ncbi:hypothetical protein DICPUDRAFT_154580 [Dictyostelium purpureum]|uniref:Uncharacterized protein n=1 Tax=Dictyostelium purpureum TaxID=5786 RepID=F0ZRQ1_DICPU|nr:uncharacterized protein DICPUDRAFT_154580 [Dictyostelium purpureum]EGC33389.1 hypothetical protein DICPUDRAFT_154580 [Dictyostelium purpureum]|eukprot:XP_003290097.1 hypothetical protein DICPUDRAFT_154580 [Dictyostelium purpureum]
MINNNDIQLTNYNDIVKQICNYLKDISSFKEFKKYWNVEYTNIKEKSNKTDSNNENNKLKLKDYVESFVKEKIFNNSNNNSNNIKGITFKLVAEIDLIGNNESLWIRILLRHSSGANNNIINNSNNINNINNINNNIIDYNSNYSVIYIKHYLNSEYYFISYSSRINFDFLLQSLSLVFNYKSIKNYNLSENSLDIIENYIFNNKSNNNDNDNDNSKSIFENPLLTVPSLKKRNYQLVLKSSERLQSSKEEEEEEWNNDNRVTDNLDMNLNLNLEKKIKLINNNVDSNNNNNNNNNSNNNNKNDKINNFSLLNNNTNKNNTLASHIYHGNQQRKLEFNFKTPLKSKTINKLSHNQMESSSHNNNSNTNNKSLSSLKIEKIPIEFNLLFEGENPVKGIEKLMSMNLIKKPYPSYFSSMSKKNSIIVNEFSDSDSDDDIFPEED